MVASVTSAVTIGGDAVSPSKTSAYHCPICSTYLMVHPKLDDWYVCTNCCIRVSFKWGRA